MVIQIKHNVIVLNEVVVAFGASVLGDSLVCDVNIICDVLLLLY